MKERWERFAADNYEVSNGGIIRRATPGRGTWAGRELKRVVMGMGYFVVNPVIDGKNVLMYVHKIVAVSFLGDPDDGLEVNHIDGNKLNNVLSNLEYVTHQRNMQHARELRLINDRKMYSDDAVGIVRDLAANGMKSPSIAKQTGISARHCRDIINNKLRRTICR
jgi:hypothetical protein